MGVHLGFFPIHPQRLNTVVMRVFLFYSYNSIESVLNIMIRALKHNDGIV